MTGTDGVSRRVFLARLGIGFNAIVATLLGVPIVRYILSPITRERRPGYESWLSLGSLDQFPEGQTRFATYRNPVVNAWDGETATIACWVRRLAGEKFQVFAINCAHLGYQLRAPRVPRPLVPAIELVHVPVSRWRLLRGRLARLRTAGPWLVRISLQDRSGKSLHQGG